MPLTPEQKRLSRQKKKQKILDDVARLGKLLIQLAPTQSNLRTPLKPELLGTAMDHGGHQRALNFPDNVDSLVGKVGDLSIGMVYDGHWKELSKIAGKGIKPRCNKSEWLCFDKDSSNEGSWEALDQKDTNECESFHLI
jgi:hypothetical protein